MTLDETLTGISKLLAQNGLGLQTRVTAVYERELSGYFSVDRLKAIQDLSGVPIPEPLVQPAYERLIGDIIQTNRHTEVSDCAALSVMRELIGVTGYQPKVSLEVVQKSYMGLIEHLPYGRGLSEQAWDTLKELTGIEAMEETVREGYIKFLNGGLADGHYGDKGEAFRWLREKTGTSLGSEVEDKIQGIYEHYTSQGSIWTVVKLVKETGILPEKIQEIYQQLFDAGDIMYSPLVDLVRATGVKFSILAEAVQKRYKEYFEAGDCGHLRNIPPLVEATGIKPEFQESEVLELSRKLLENGRPDEYLLLKGITGRELSKTDERKAFVHGISH